MPGTSISFFSPSDEEDGSQGDEDFSDLDDEDDDDNESQHSCYANGGKGLSSKKMQQYRIQETRWPALRTGDSHRGGFRDQDRVRGSVWSDTHGGLLCVIPSGAGKPHEQLWCCT